MRYIIAMIALGLLFSCTPERPEEPVSVPFAVKPGKLHARCVDGYVFVVWQSGFAGGITQVFENGPDGLRAQVCPPVKDGE